MHNNYPFHYEVRFKLFAFDNQNNLRIESSSTVFKDKNPLENRQDAFEAFDFYLSFPAQYNRLEKNQKGNFVITQPFVPDLIPPKESMFKNSGWSKKEINELKLWRDNIGHFREYISIYLILKDELVARTILDASDYNGQVETEFEIHRVASYDFGGQEIVDNLDMYELPLYSHYGIDISELVQTVYHFGEDYDESGEDVEGGAKRIILRTPHIWNTLEHYISPVESNDESELNAAEVGSTDFLSIIDKGEGNQVEFKPSLLFNFKTGKGGISVKYIIAKTICSFLNSNGGILFVGVNDDKTIQGLKYDYSLFPEENPKDKILLELDSLISFYIGISIMPLITPTIESIDGKDVLVIYVEESDRPILINNKWGGQVLEEFYIRMSASTHQLVGVKKIISYIFNKKWKSS